MIENKIISMLLTLLSNTFNDNIYRDMILFTEIHNKTDMSIYQLVIKGERDINTPFYCGSIMTHIIKEDYYEGEIVYASIIFEERR